MYPYKYMCIYRERYMFMNLSLQIYMSQFPVSPPPLDVWVGSHIPSMGWVLSLVVSTSFQGRSGCSAGRPALSGCPGQPRLHCHLPVPLVSDFSYGVEDKVCMSKAQSCGAPGSDPFGGTLFFIWPVYFVLSICWALQGDCTNSLWSHKNNMIQIWKSNTDCLTSLFNHH